MAAFENQALDWPSFATVKAGPYGPLDTAAWAVAVAVDQYIAAFHGEPREAAHAAIVGILWAIRQDLAEGQVLPSVTAVCTGGSPASARIGAFLRPVTARVVVDCAVAQLRDGSFASAVSRKRLAGLPGFAAVITVNGVGVVLRPFGAIVLASLPSGGAEQPALVFAVAQGDTVIVHVH